MIPRSLLLPLLLLPLAACSPVYVARSAAGHADLLLRRRDIGKAIEDPRTPPGLRARLEVARDARLFAFDGLGLKRSRAFSSYSPVARSAVTYIVSASRKTKLEPYVWSFPIVGRFPYKGYFVKPRAQREKRRLEGLGYDATLSGAAAYKTPLPFADPLPSSALAQSTGALSALLIHELAHGTVYFKNQTAFDEAAAEFIGERGAQEFLTKRFGPASEELAAYRRELQADGSVAAAFARLRAKLEALYAGQGSESEKLRRREDLFAEARAELERLGFPVPGLNNAVVLAHGLYHADAAPFESLLGRCGGDWRRFVRALRGLDGARPMESLRSLSSCP